MYIARGEAYVHAFLAYFLDEVEWLASHHFRSMSEVGTRLSSPFDKRLCVPFSWCGLVETRSNTDSGNRFPTLHCLISTGFDMKMLIVINIELKDNS